MFKKFKNLLQILVCIALAAQMAGCFFVDRDRHHDDRGHYDRDPSLDIKVHG
ncbi:MAG: hypothetical protein HQL26_06800 [Candidatus Omnitrophica bacterium]|nr:hypothetical protein [Candidatus Omnitrophota bacterium]